MTDNTFQPPIDGHVGDISEDLIEADLDWLELALNSSNSWGNRSFRSDYDEAITLRGRRQLTANVGHIPISVTKHAKYGFNAGRSFGEGDDHRFAKYLASAWIRSLGGTPVKEHHRYGGRVDVYCEKLPMAVECGSLSVDRLLDMLFDQRSPRVIVIPLSSELDGAMGGYGSDVPYLEFALQGDWGATREHFKALRMERARAIAESLTFDDDDLSAPSLSGAGRMTETSASAMRSHWKNG